MNITIILISVVWLLSIFWIARWRFTRICRSDRNCSVVNDFPLQVYMKVSGIGLLFWIALILGHS